MSMFRIVFVMTLLAWPLPGIAQSLLVPMDRVQENHLKAYGLTYWALEQYGEAEWLLNYRGGILPVAQFRGATAPGCPPRHHRRACERRRHRRNPGRDCRFEHGDGHLGEGAQDRDLHPSQQHTVG